MPELGQLDILILAQYIKTNKTKILSKNERKRVHEN
jgi:hypothetical protein